MSAENLHIPQKSNSALTSQSVKDIMNAYNSQSKIQLYDDNSALSSNEVTGVKGRDIPLSALKPGRFTTDASGNVMSIPKTRLAEESESRRAIASAYNKMRGIEEETEDDDYDENIEYNEEGIPVEIAPRGDFSNIKRFKADYVEDIPEDDEGLLEILALAIRNARANLEMLESLYAALHG